jgi:hypothetical protein
MRDVAPTFRRRSHVELEPLFEGQLLYDDDGVWVYRGTEGTGYCEGGGLISGTSLSGTVRWSNMPSRRDDGVWTSTFRGSLRTDDGAGLLFELRARTMPERAPGASRDMTGSMLFRAADERYSWLDRVQVVCEGKFAPTAGRMTLRAYVCRNDLPSGVIELIDHNVQSIGRSGE